MLREGIETLLRDEIAPSVQQGLAEQTAFKTQLAKLTQERQKLLEAHYADAGALALFTQEQKRSTTNMTNIQSRLDRISSVAEDI